MLPGEPYQFRVTMRRRPPLGYDDRLVRTEESRSALQVMFLGSGLEITPAEPVVMRPAGRAMTAATATVSAPGPGSYHLMAQLFEGDEYVKSLQLTLRVGSTEAVLDADSDEE